MIVRPHDQPRAGAPGGNPYSDCGTDALEVRLWDLQRLHDATLRVARLRDWADAANEILQAALVATGASKGLLAVGAEGQPPVMSVAASAGFTERFLARIQTSPAGCGGDGAAVQRRQRVVVVDVDTDPTFADCRDAAHLGGFRSCHSVPLIAGEEALGALTVHFDARHQPDEREMRLMDLYAQMAAGFLERTRATATAARLERDALLLAAIVETSFDAIISKNLDGVITSWNQSAERLFGYTAAEAVGRPVTMLIPPDRQGEESGILARIRAGERIEHFETRRLRKDGVILDLSLSISPIRDARGTIIGASKIARNITERKRAETRLRAAEQALRVSERQLRLVTDNAMVCLAQYDRELRIKFMNRPFAGWFGYAAADVIGRPLVAIIGEPAYAAMKDSLERALNGERVEIELQLDCGQIGARWLRMLHEPERNPDGDVVGLVSVTTDITTRKESEGEMEQTRDRALAAARAKDDFLAALSHELRTPLNPVLLLASEAADDLTLAPRIRGNFEVIRKNVELEARLIDDLLDLTRITRGKLSLSFGTHLLRTILKDALDTIRPEIAHKQLHLASDIADCDALVWADAVRLQQVLWNVVKNAVKFTPDGGRIEVRAWTDADRGVAVVEVTDTGIGMTEDELGRVFDAFAQGEHAAGGGSHRFGGLGLGLAISRLLTELHHGSIRALSAGRDRGSHFVLELPLCGLALRQPFPPRDAADRPPEEATPVGGAGPTTVPAIRRRLLLVEDHDATRSALAQLLVRRNYEVTVSATMAEARSLAGRHAFDLVISDVGLPDGNGNDLMAELRRARPGLVGIALTGYGMDHDVVRSQAAGFTVHLTKPVTIQSLDRALELALQRPEVPDHPTTAGAPAAG